MQIDIVSDVICPWCFIGKRRLERALALRPDLSATLSWRAFQLNPDMPSDGISRELYLAAKFSGSRAAGRSYAAVCAAGRIEGIDFAFERIRRTPNTLRAHRLIRLAAFGALPVHLSCIKTHIRVRGTHYWSWHSSRSSDGSRRRGCSSRHCGPQRVAR